MCEPRHPSWFADAEPLLARYHVARSQPTLLVWWGILYGRYGRAGYGVAALFVFLSARSLRGARRGHDVRPRPLYPHYIASSHDRRVDPLDDQQFAGLIMWVPAGFVLTVFGLGLFVAWLGEAERREARDGAARGVRVRCY